jgi:hypothetical protein
LADILSSGLLYQYDCLSAAATCQNWYHTWKKVENRLPDFAKVELFVGGSKEEGELPSWFRDDVLRDVPMLQFVRRIFDKLNALRVTAAGPTAALLEWGTDVQVAVVFAWEVDEGDLGGAMWIDFGKKKDEVYLVKGPNDNPPNMLSGPSVFRSILVGRDLTFQGCVGIHIAPGQPLWP